MGSVSTEGVRTEHRSGRGYRVRVTRIIAGRAGSITLEVPDAGTRPTSDRVRESLFGALESADALRGAAVLDLYAGSGALALEAVSRGAASADLVEKSPRAAAVVERNAARVAKSVGRGTPIRVHRASVAAYLGGVRGPFDVIFVDPPYDLGETELSESLGLLLPSLSDHAVVVVERASRSPEPALPPGLDHARNKRYGDTTLWWLRPGSAIAAGDQPERESQSR
jgi:16S rRNA (guanine966-N2)-methyltransferase